MAILTNWVTKLVVITAIIAVIGFDAIQVLVAHVGGKDDANNAAYAAAQAWFDSKGSYAAAIEAARQAIPATDQLSNTGCSSQDGQNWTCTIRRPAHPILMNHIGFLEKYDWATETGTGSYQP